MPRSHDTPTLPEGLDTLGDRVRYVLFVKDMGMNELDRLLGKSGFTTRVVRNERVPRLDTATQLGTALRVDPVWLLNGSGSLTVGYHRVALNESLLTNAASIRHSFRQVRTAVSAEAADTFFHVCVARWRTPHLGSQDPRTVMAMYLLASYQVDPHSPFEQLTIEKAFKLTDVYISSSVGKDLSHVDLFTFEADALDIAHGNFSGPSAPGRSLPRVEPPAKESAEIRRSGMRLRDLQGWKHAMMKAKHYYPTVPGWAYDFAGECPAIVDVEPDAQIVGEIARSYHEAHLRSGGD